VDLSRTIALLLLTSAPALCQRVTEEARVRIDGRIRRVRKINGRWWSDDNRQLTRPKNGGFIWWITSDALSEFSHHRPVDLARAESLHLFMDRDSVRALLGDPNASLEKAGIWEYYAEDGTELFVRFFGEQLGEAIYRRSDYGLAGRPVQSIAQELNGRSIYAIMADRAWQRSSPESYAKHHASSPAAPVTVIQSHVSKAPAPPAKKIPKELFDEIHAGMSRAEVVAKLGDPSGGLRIGGGNETENLTYALDPSGQATVSFKSGIVVRVTQSWVTR
jgi:hypothetical protein